jgi:hypothetical protein
VAEGLAFIFWDEAGDEPGVYVRRLRPDGSIAGPAQRVSAVHRHQFHPTLVRAGNQGYWILWEEPVGEKTDDLMARRLKADLAPQGAPVRLTALGSERGSVSRPDAAVLNGNLFGVFALSKLKSSQIVLLAISLSELESTAGLPKEAEESSQHKRHLGNLYALTKMQGKPNQPRITCAGEGCFIAWDNEGGGASVAYFNARTRQRVWHREFAAGGSRPACATAAWGTSVVWFEQSRVKIAALGSDGLGEPTVLGKVSGYQPYPALAAGTRPGEWYTSWRDYESGHLEVYVARAGCNDESRGP